MLKPFRLAICLLAATALGASGCGSSSKAGTTTTTVTPQAGTTAPSNQSAQAGGQSAKGATTGPNTGGVPAGTSSTSAKPTATSAQPTATSPAKAPAPKPRPKPLKDVLPKSLSKSQQQKAEELVAKSKAISTGFLSEVPPARRYEPQVYLPFLAQCKAGKGSLPSCECVVVKQELLSHEEKGQAIAELLTIQLALEKGASFAKIAHHGVLLPPNAQRAAVECSKF